MTPNDFIGQDADLRRKQEIETAVKTVREIIDRLEDMQVFGPSEILTELLPAIVLDHIQFGIGDAEGDVDVLMNRFVLAMQKLHVDQIEWEEGETRPEGLGCRWNDPALGKEDAP